MVKTIFAISFGIGLSYLFSWTLRDIFRMAHGPLLQVRRGRNYPPYEQALLTMAFRIGVFYAMVVALITFGTSGIITLLNGDPPLALSSLLAALFLVAIARLMALSYSGFLLRSLYGLSLSVIGALGYLVISNPDYAHKITTTISNGDFVRLYGLGVICVSFITEGFWYVSQRFPGKTKLVTYSLFREYDEGYEQHDMAAYRQPMIDLFSRSAKKSILEFGMKSLCWKTWSGEPIIARAILESVCIHITSSGSQKPYHEMANEKGKIEEQARDILRKLAEAGEAQVIMPSNPHYPAAPNEVEAILGIKPILIPDVGNRRYLVLNRRIAIISLPIPAEISRDADHFISETGSNFAIATSSPSRVHHCLQEFESLLRTYQKDFTNS